eukprot:TRINITY_DN4366_c0_g1_i2.p1 TRINITY_DN4366_c0_g1~~TRINITY_DN4366_c0_g1_i2.p1  ORF type:complete len:198 (-),score=18.15 TRINITY_DN4366_c0_g1_i2:41-634(-)
MTSPSNGLLCGSRLTVFNTTPHSYLRGDELKPLVSLNRNYFWSSKPNPDPESNEYLIYELTAPIARLESVMIYPFENIHCYGPRKVKVSVGYRADEYHYSTTEIPCENTSDAKIIDLPTTDKLPVGRYVRIDLIGRWQKHFAMGYQDRYYTCISTVILLGTKYEAIPGEPLRKGFLRAAEAAWEKERNQQPCSNICS